MLNIHGMTSKVYLTHYLMADIKTKHVFLKIIIYYIYNEMSKIKSRSEQF